METRERTKSWNSFELISLDTFLHMCVGTTSVAEYNAMHFMAFGWVWLQVYYLHLRLTFLLISFLMFTISIRGSIALSSVVPITATTLITGILWASFFSRIPRSTVNQNKSELKIVTGQFNVFVFRKKFKWKSREKAF